MFNWITSFEGAKQLTDQECDIHEEAKEINLSIGKHLGANNKARNKLDKECGSEDGVGS